ncbi:hypothetical protein [Specibacter sp. RAF43]|uniref:hypothetical protein n=1 Tax=Specibacter sp. RAF43 TaxID=3233057 RepID=UPI003F9B7ED0
MSRPPENPATVPEPNSPLPARPVGVTVIAAVVGLEALAVLAAAIYSVAGLAAHEVRSIGSALFLAVLLLGLAAGLGAVAVNAYKGMRWTRSAAFVWQLLMVAVAVPALVSGAVPAGLALLLPPVLAVYYLFTPKVVAFSQRTGGEHPVL